MTPSNPSNQNPFILCIMDALGIPHQVAPLEHTHSYAEVSGLADEISELWAGLNEKANAEDVTEALATKQDTLTFDTTPTANSTNPVTSGGVKEALDDKMPANYIPDKVECVEDAGRVIISLFESPSRGMTARIYIENEGAEVLSAEINADNIGNFIRALQNPDTLYPTEDSDNLITSGAVYKALQMITKLQGDYHSEVGVQNKHSGDDEFDEAYVNGYNRIALRVGSGTEQQSAYITPQNMANIVRALLSPDATPTANSDRLVTSGGVKTALDGKAPAGDTDVIFDEGENILVYLPNYFTNGERQRSFILDYQGDTTDLISLFMAEPNDTITFLSHDGSIIMVGQCYFAVRVVKQTGGVGQGDTYYIIFDGKVEY